VENDYSAVIRLPFGDIDCSALNTFLSPSLWRVPDKDRESVYARAVARLMAHELYHVIAQTTSHARSGVAELLSDRFEFTESTRNELHPGEYAEPAGYDNVSGNRRCL
jgi:hypothetical protein